jgi:DNA ligase (NAD+)
VFRNFFPYFIPLSEKKFLTFPLSFDIIYSYLGERETLRQIVPPTNCPACNSILDFVNDQLFCLNDSCSAKSAKRIEHFAKTLKIKGLGPATIARLDLFDLHDIYSLSQEEISLCLDSEKLGTKLHNEIQKSKSVDLITLLPAFSIPLIGSSATNKLAQHISSLSEITPEICIEAGLGPKAASNLMDWLVNTFHFQGYYNLPFSFTCKKQAKVSLDDTKGTVCISGKLKSYPTKAAATQVLEKYGFIVKSSLTKDVTILLNESGIESAKTKKAEELGIKIFNNLKQIIEEK